MLKKENHYDYLQKHLPEFFKAVGVSWDNNTGIISAHGDKAYGYKEKWEKAGIPFPQGVAIYLLSYCTPYAKEVRETSNGWVAPKDWVIDNWDRFKRHLPSNTICVPK